MFWIWFECFYVIACPLLVWTRVRTDVYSSALTMSAACEVYGDCMETVLVAGCIRQLTFYDWQGTCASSWLIGKLWDTLACISMLLSCIWTTAWCPMTIDYWLRDWRCHQACHDKLLQHQARQKTWWVAPGGIKPLSWRMFENRWARHDWLEHSALAV